MLALRHSFFVNASSPSSGRQTCARGSGWVPQTIEKAGKDGWGLPLLLRRQGAFPQRPTKSGDYPTSAERTLASGYMQKVPLALVCKALKAIKNKAFWVFRDNAVQHRGSPANATRWAATPRRACDFRYLVPLPSPAQEAPAKGNFLPQHKKRCQMFR